MGQWAQAEEAELIEEEQEVWGEEIAAATWKRKTLSGQAGAGVGELEHWIATFPEHPSPVDPQ